MANDLTPEFVWIVDTASATTLKADVTLRVNIAAMRWVSNAASAGDQVVVKDGTGKIVWETRATGANYVEETRMPYRSTGLAVTTLTSGTLYIYLDPLSRP